MKWYHNPPINLSGPRVDLNGDFSLEITIDNSLHPEQAAHIDLYGTLPVLYDEWRQDGRNIRFTLKNGGVSVFVNMVKAPFTGSNVGSLVKLKLQRQDNQLIFFVNGTKIGYLNENLKDSVFLNNQIYFGADAELGGGFTINSISVNGAKVSDNGAEMIKKYVVPQDSLKAYANHLQRSLPIGTAAHANGLLSDPKYGQILAQNFSMITPEFDFKFQAIHPQPHLYAFGEADELVEFALKNNIRIHGHTLVWHEALPSWVWSLYKSGQYQQLKTALRDHISTGVRRYKGVIKEWDTLNEIFSSDSEDPEGFRSNSEDEDNISIWYKAFGKQIYIDALRKVKSIDPNCENWINDFGIDQAESNDKLSAMIKFINYANGLGYGHLIDGIGFQSHNYNPVEDPSKASEMKYAMERIINEAHVKVRISELDVNDASENPMLFADKLDVCLKIGSSCASFGMWGFTDKFSSMTAPAAESSMDNYTSPTWSAYLADALIFDQHYMPKKSYHLLKETLRQAP
ncbi:MAG: endo-1,4-beta-xylanase [Bacillota bacterium]